MKKDDKKEDVEKVETDDSDTSDEVLESGCNDSENPDDEPDDDGSEESGDEDEGEDEDETVVEAARIVVESAVRRRNRMKAKKPITESVGKRSESARKIPDAVLEASNISEYQEMRLRDNAMTIVHAWLENGDFSYDAIYGLCVSDADFDKSGELDDPAEVSYYNELILAVADALVGIGIDKDLAQKFIDREDDDAAEEVGNQLSEIMGDEDVLDTGDVINKYAVSGMVTEGAAIPIVESTYKAVSGGQVVIKQKKIRHKPLSPARKAGLAKARKKAHSASANAHRRKSMKIHKQKLG